MVVRKRPPMAVLILPGILPAPALAALACGLDYLKAD